MYNQGFLKILGTMNLHYKCRLLITILDSLIILWDLRIMKKRVNTVPCMALSPVTMIDSVKTWLLMVVSLPLSCALFQRSTFYQCYFCTYQIATFDWWHANSLHHNRAVCRSEILFHFHYVVHLTSLERIQLPYLCWSLWRYHSPFFPQGLLHIPVYSPQLAKHPSICNNQTFHR